MDLVTAAGSQPVSAAAMTVIFAHVLRCASVEADADFFDLGGDSILALALLAEVERVTGRDLPITTLYDAPTPAAMAALLAQQTPRGRESCLVLFKPGDGVPLFIAHGLGGSVMELRELGRLLETDGAVYGIEARGLDGVAAPLDRVEDMAACHLEEIRRVWPSGPYRLAGFSFGGLVALEMAQRLTRAGETVSFLGLLDTYPHSRFWPPRCRVAAWGRLVRAWLSPAIWRRMAAYHAHVLSGLPRRERPTYVVTRAGRAMLFLCGIFRIFHVGNMLRRFADGSGQPAPAAMEVTPVVARVQRAGLAAFAAYRPAAYDGDITFVKAAGDITTPFQPRTLWRTLARKIAVHTVPGDHQGLVRDGVGPLSSVLSAALSRADKAPAGRPSGTAR